MQSLIIESPNKTISEINIISLLRAFFGSGFVKAIFSIAKTVTTDDKTRAVITSPFILKIQPKIKNKIARISISLFPPFYLLKLL